jgi:hypothetical protein
MTKYKTEEGKLFVEIIPPTQEEVNNYYRSSGEFKSTGNSDANQREFKTAKIKHTFDEVKYPIDSIWIMGESPGMKVNYRGEKIIIISKNDLYARVIQ